MEPFFVGDEWSVAVPCSPAGGRPKRRADWELCWDDLEEDDAQQQQQQQPSLLPLGGGGCYRREYKRVARCAPNADVPLMQAPAMGAGVLVSMQAPFSPFSEVSTVVLHGPLGFDAGQAAFSGNSENGVEMESEVQTQHSIGGLSRQLSLPDIRALNEDCNMEVDEQEDFPQGPYAPYRLNDGEYLF